MKAAACVLPHSNAATTETCSTTLKPLARQAWVLAVCVLVFLAAGRAVAQVAAPDEQGTKPFGSYYGSDIESVNMDNGRVVLHIPLYSIPQRGELKTQYYLTYINSGFKQVNNQLPGCEPKTACPPEYQIQTAGSFWGVVPIIPGGQNLYVDATDHYTGQTGANGYPYYEKIIELHTNDGGIHTLAYSSGAYRTIDGSGWEFLPNTQNSQYPLGGMLDPTQPDPPDGISGTLIDSSGTQYTWTQSGDTSNTLIKDVDGNYITMAGDSITSDTMGRAIPEPPSVANGNYTSNTVAGCPNLNAPNQPTPSYGVPWQPPLYDGDTTDHYLFCFTAVTVKTAFYPEEDPPYFEDLTQTYPMLQSIVLPDGKYWGFIYDSSDGSSTAYGDLVKIILPTGGSISNAWTTAQTCAGSGAVAGFFRVITSRTMTSAAGSAAWTYSADGGPSASVTDPDGNQTKYTFTDESGSGTGCTFYETQRQYLQNENGTLVPIKTVATQYTTVQDYDARDYGAAFPTQVTTTWNTTGQSFVTTTQYDSGFTATTFDCAGPGTGPSNLYCSEPTVHMLFGLPVSQSVYDYSGSLLKNAQTSYEWQSNGAYLTANLLNTPSQVTVTGSSGESQTDYTYDASSRIGLTSGVNTMIGPAPTPGVYGHVTTTTKWLNVGGTTPNTYTYWLNDGEVDHEVDPNGNTTAYQYSSDYDGAYRTTTTNPLGQSVSMAYDFNTGLETSSTDLNGNVTRYDYDAMNRPTSVSDPDGGSTSYTYDPSGYADNSVLTAKLMCSGASNCGAEESSGQTEHSLEFYDGFGRPFETELLSDPSGPVYTVTSYDPLGNVASVTNSYRSTNDSTYGSTTYQYDMLGRKTQLQHEPGGTTETWSYSGNVITFTDENGNQWQRTSDALGRLTKVLEPNGSNKTPSMETDYTYDALGNLLNVGQWGGPSGSSGERVRTFNYDSLSRLLCASNPENSTGTCPTTATGSYVAGTTGYVYDADGNVTTKTSPAVNASSGSQTIGYCYDSLNRVTYKFYSGSFSCTSPSGFADSYTYDTSSVTGHGNDVGHLTDEKAYIGGTLIAENEPYRYDLMGQLTAEQQIPWSPAGTAYQFLYDYDLAGDVTCKNNGFTPSGYTGTCDSLPMGSYTLADLSSYDTAGRLQWAKTSVLPSSFAIGTYPSYLLQTNESPSVVAYDAMGHLIEADFAATASSGGTHNAGLSRTYNPRGELTNETDEGMTAAYATGLFSVSSSTGGEQYTGRSTGTFTFTGTEQSKAGGSGTVYDSGSWVAFVNPGGNECTAGVNYGEGSTDASLASGLAASLNSSCSSLVTATASGGTVTVTSVATGSGSDYALTSYLPGYDYQDFPSGPSFTLTGSTMIGGASATYDSGTFTIVVSDQNDTCAPAVSYGEGSTTSTLASAVSSALNSSCSQLVSARANGTQVTVTAVTPGTGSDYNLSAGLDIYNYQTFSSPSFAISPTSMTGGGGSATPVYSYQASYDSVGNVTSYDDSVMGTWGFGYDTLNRLTGTTGNPDAAPWYVNETSYGCWSYDGFGNRTMEAFWTGSASPCGNGGSGANLQLTVTTQSPNDNNQVAGYEYDDAGNVLYDNRNHYLYDTDGRICAVSSQITGTWEYLYDAEGNRIAKVAQSILGCGAPSPGTMPSNEYLLDKDGQQVTELALSGSSMTPSHTNVFADGRLLATYDFPDGGVHLALADPLATRRVQASGAGVVELGFISLPFGNDANNTTAVETVTSPPFSGGTDATDLHFTGKQRDTETGNDYFGARYYSSAIGRFVSPDDGSGQSPADPQSWNLYSYVRNNPLTRTDPDGHCGSTTYTKHAPGDPSQNTPVDQTESYDDWWDCPNPGLALMALFQDGDKDVGDSTEEMAKGENPVEQLFRDVFDPDRGEVPIHNLDMTPADLGWPGPWWMSGTGPAGRYAKAFKWYIETTLKEDLKVYRGWGGDSLREGNADGTWYSLLPTSPGSFTESYRDQMSLLPKWNSMTTVDEVTIPAGKTVYIGPAAALQDPDTQETIYEGGGIQVWVPK